MNPNDITIGEILKALNKKCPDSFSTVKFYDDGSSEVIIKRHSSFCEEMDQQFDNLYSLYKFLDIKI